MSRLIVTSFIAIMSISMYGQSFCGHYVNEEYKIRFELNLDSATVAVPGIPDEFCYGYLQGNLNGTWIVLKVVGVKDGTATVRTTCDNGSDSQTIELFMKDANTIIMSQVKDANIKTIEGRKYVKLPKKVEFKK